MATNKKLKELKIALQIIFICNPFSMCLFNLVAPAKAAAFAHKKEFSPLMADVYGFWSYWLPWHWKKHWIAYEVLADYPVEDQCRYFLECSKTPETLGKMSEKAQDILWSVITAYPKTRGTYSRQNTADTVWCKNRMLFNSSDVLPIFAKAPVKLKDEQVKYLLENKKFEVFQQYLSRGAIRYEQVKMLVHAAVYAHPTLPLYKPQVGDGGLESGTAHSYTEAEIRAIERSYQADQQIFLEILINYVKRHGVKTEIFAYVDGFSAGERVYDVRQALSSALKVHEQCVFTSSHQDDERLEEWQTFCQNTPEICVEAQMRMSLKQYDVYHSTGHILQAEAIAYFIRKGNIDICRKIFVNEPENGFINEEIAHLIHANNEVQALFYQVLKELHEKSNF